MRANKQNGGFFLYGLAHDEDHLLFPCKRKLYLLLHNFGALIILFMLKKLKENCWSRLKDMAESMQKIAS